MYDLSQPNSKPGICVKCKGSGTYSFGGTVNGKAAKSGMCFSCKGTGYQDKAQIAGNECYNRHKIATIIASDFREPDEDYNDRDY
jgi:hypothetical protein